MNKKEKYDYIFGNPPGEYVVNRLGWLDALLSDIRTLIDRYQCLRKNSKGSEAYGASNISIPVLVCTGLELISKLFVGNTSNATENVSKFIDEFFPAHGKKIPRIIWDGIRNGTNHNFSPNSI